MKIIKSQRGAHILVYNNFLYNKDKHFDSHQRWRCRLRGCKAFLNINHENIIIFEKNHTCNEPENLRLSKIAALEIRERLKSTNEQPSRVYTEITSKLNENVIANISKFEHVRDYATKERNTSLNFRINVDFDIPQPLRITLNQKLFLQYDSGVLAERRFVIFFNDEFKEILSKVEVFIIDGTFKSSPQSFYQLITFQGKLFGCFFPLIFIITNGKTESCYNDIFNYLQENDIIKPKYLVTDFEMALKNACLKFSTLIEQYGCNFHYGQAIWRKVQNLGLSEEYKSCFIIKNIITMILNLAYIDLDIIELCYQFIKNEINHCNLNETLSEFINYYERTFFGNENIKELFDKPFWNCCKRIKTNIPRTTNSLEGWHRALNANILIPNPNIGRFIDSLQQETEKVRVKLARLRNGNFELSRSNNEKEYKLLVICQNQHLYEIQTLFDVLRSTIDWNLN